MPKKAKEKKKWSVGIGKSQGLGVGSSTFRVTVGKEKKSFYIHEDIVASRTEYFTNLWPISKKEGNAKVVRLPEEDPEIFALYIELVYTGAIPYMIKNDQKDDWSCRSDADRGHHDSCVEEYNTLCKLYALAEKVEDTKAQIATITALAEKIDDSINHVDCISTKFCFPPVESINIMYENTRPYSAGQKLLAHTYARHSEDGNPLPNVDQVPPLFLFDVAEMAIEIRDYNEEFDHMDLPWYHQVIEDGFEESDDDEEPGGEGSNGAQEPKDDQKSNDNQKSDDTVAS